MLDQLLLVIGKLNELSRSNPMLATVLGAGGATAIVMSLRQIPGRIVNFIFGQITTSLTLNNAGWDGSYEQFRSFMNWYVKHSWSRWSRSLSLETQSQNHGDPSVSLGAGFGTHFFWYGGRLFWFIKSKLESSGTAVEKYEITIRGFTRNRTIFMNMMEEFRYRVQSNTISVYTWDFDSWSNPSPITRRPLETVIMERGLKERLISDINCFFESREWYEQRGLPYKRCILFYGPPGTGKTSIIKALASNYSRNVYILNLSLLSDTSLVRALSMVPEGAIVLIEDFDTNKTVIRRNSGNNESAVPAPNQTEHPQPIIQQQPETFTALSLSGLLNSLDGIVPLDGMLIFMTTNHIEKIDPALLRNGRVDRREYIGYLNDPEVRDYIELVFPGTLVSEAIQFKPIPGCDLMTHFADNRYDVNAFVESIPKDYDPTLIAPTEERLPVLEVPVLKEPAEITIQPTLLF